MVSCSKGEWHKKKSLPLYIFNHVEMYGFSALLYLILYGKFE